MECKLGLSHPEDIEAIHDMIKECIQCKKSDCTIKKMLETWLASQ